MTATKVSTEVKLSSCPTCLEIFLDPHVRMKAPSCDHILCESCLNMLKKMAEKGKYQRNCPNCRKEFKTPRDGIASFNTKYRFCSSAEHYQTLADDLPPEKARVPLCPDEKMHFCCANCNSLAGQAGLVIKHNGAGRNIDGIKEEKQEAEMRSASAITRAESQTTEENNAQLELKEAEIQNTEFNQNIENQIDKGTEHQINKLQAKRQELESRDDRAGQSRSEETGDSHRATESETEITAKIGNIHISKPKAPAEKSRSIKWIQTLDGFTSAERISCTTEGLIAVCYFDGKKVVTYHKVNDKYEKKLDLKLTQDDQHETNSIAIGPDGRFLVGMNKCIKVYSPDGNHQNDINIQSIQGSRDVDVCHMQVASEGRILVGDYIRSLIVETNYTGEVIRTIHTSIKPVFMTLINDTHIAISDYEAGKVIVIGRESEKETLSIDIKEVTGICYDEHTKCLLTANSAPGREPGHWYIGTGVIEQYCYTTGKLIACLKRGLYKPMGMALTSDGHLFIANDKTVEIYETK